MSLSPDCSTEMAPVAAVSVRAVTVGVEISASPPAAPRARHLELDLAVGDAPADLGARGSTESAELASIMIRLSAPHRHHGAVEEADLRRGAGRRCARCRSS